MMPFFWKTTPSVTPEALFDSHDKEEGHGDHPVYDDDTLRRVISTGVDPANRTLDNLMPRWHMSKPDMDDLITFLKS